MIKIDKNTNEFYVSGTFEDIIQELVDVADYCSAYLVCTMCEGGKSFDVAKEELEIFLLKIVKELVSNVEYIPSSKTDYTS